jgi:hypothetical protein
MPVSLRRQGPSPAEESRNAAFVCEGWAPACAGALAWVNPSQNAKPLGECANRVQT